VPAQTDSVCAGSAPGCDAPHSRDAQLTVLRSGALWIVLAVAPFTSVYVTHFASAPGLATGFIHADMPYYAANGREIFEGGNGFAYPNPYDPAADAPVIYFHWLIWILGGIIHLGVDPGLVFVAAAVLGAALMSAATWCLLAVVLPRRELRGPVFLAVMWGGGILCISKLLANIAHSDPWAANLLEFDPGRGLWFLSWGRNLLFPTESIYHAIVAASWCCALTRRYWWSIGLAALLGATHPWSGLELLLTITALQFVRLLFLDGRAAVGHCVLASVCLVVFLGYNLVWLDSFPQHRALRQTWELNWSLSNRTIVLAWLPVAALAVGRMILDRNARNQRTVFLLLAFAVAFLLSIHDRFMSPTQPLHFTRGYVWMPLVLIALPVVQDVLIRFHQWARRPVFGGVVILTLLLVSFDNIVFLTEQSRAQWNQVDGFRFASADQRQLLEQADAAGLTGITVAADKDLSYLLATYTALTPYAGHQFNTPDYDTRREHIDSYYAGTNPDVIAWRNPVEYVIQTAADSRPTSPWDTTLQETVLQNGAEALDRIRRP
jgi:hypothetical protein